MGRIKVAVAGASGKMGQASVSAIRSDPELQLVGAVARRWAGRDLGEVMAGQPWGISCRADVQECLEADRPDVLVDFTRPEVGAQHALWALANGTRPVVGTTGLKKEDLAAIEQACEKSGLGAAVIANFSLGATLLARFAMEAARYFPEIEIIEMHHQDKVDAPSGTALHLAQELAAKIHTVNRPASIERLPGVRGGAVNGIRIHSLRLPGVMARHTVVLGGLGQTIEITHDSIDRNAFMPGLIIAIKKVVALDRVVYDLAALLDDGP